MKATTTTLKILLACTLMPVVFMVVIGGVMWFTLKPEAFQYIYSMISWSNLTAIYTCLVAIIVLFISCRA